LRDGRTIDEAAMRKPVVAFLGFVVLVLTVAWLFGFGPPLGIGRPISASEHGGIESLQLVPFPEGPNSPLFEDPPAPASSVPLSAVEEYIPDPLPAPRWQGVACNIGGDLVVTFADGETVSYGPCKKPTSIQRLGERMIIVLNEPGR
jgi:hypothetical protein